MQEQLTMSTDICISLLLTNLRITKLHF